MLTKNGNKPTADFSSAIRMPKYSGMIALKILWGIKKKNKNRNKKHFGEIKHISLFFLCSQIMISEG